jgi:hypothetical protein
LLNRRERLLFQPRMRRQSQVIVRRQIDDPAAIDRRVRGLPVVEHPQAPVEPLSFERVELVGEE